MNNPWTNIKVAEYEGHMKFIKQYDLLNRIFKEQIAEHQGETIGILGIGCGNGLEYIEPKTLIYGYDINNDFLNECRNRHYSLGKNLILNRIDLADKNIDIHPCDFLISNLVLEYIGLYNFIRIVRKSNPRYISIVTQMTLDCEKVISDSPYSDSLKFVSSIREDIYPQELTNILDAIGFQLVNRQIYEIDLYKSFIQMDFVSMSHNMQLNIERA